MPLQARRHADFIDLQRSACTELLAQLALQSGEQDVQLIGRQGLGVRPRK